MAHGLEKLVYKVLISRRWLTFLWSKTLSLDHPRRCQVGESQRRRGHFPCAHVLKIVSKSKHEHTKGPLNSVTFEDILAVEYIQSPSHHIKSGKADKADARQRQAIPRDAMCNSGRLLGRKAIPGTPSCVKELLVPHALKATVKGIVYREV
ncbi:hypothetical protein ARMGADRAFT_1032359 [Armillaria gallica]|uniref:Uncharacterized protein n=1 Tax=Armillaria gallica TaxID=47427 RepID=A0A2H3DP62_ARMGA|nr:hypothetical protein ARMGADRAFT_1032359 [Armillaria gallica]